MKNSINEAVLREMYVDKNMSSKQIAEILGTTPSDVYAACYKHGIKKLGRGATAKNSEAAQRFSRKTVYENYVTRNLSVEGTAEKLGTTPAIVKQLIADYNIIKPSGAYSKGNCPDKDSLQQALSDCNYSVQKLANKFGVSRMTIYNWLKQQGIESKRQKQNDSSMLEALANNTESTLESIANELHCTHAIAKRNLENAGYELYIG